VIGFWCCGVGSKQLVLWGWQCINGAAGFTKGGSVLCSMAHSSLVGVVFGAWGRPWVPEWWGQQACTKGGSVAVLGGAFMAGCLCVDSCGWTGHHPCIECVCLLTLCSCHAACSACCTPRLLRQCMQSTIRFCQDAPAEDDTQPRWYHALQGPHRLCHADLQERGPTQVLHWLPNIPCPVSDLVGRTCCTCSCG
jgi:hypothetical protein